MESNEVKFGKKSFFELFLNGYGKESRYLVAKDKMSNRDAKKFILERSQLSNADLGFQFAITHPASLLAYIHSRCDMAEELYYKNEKESN